MSETLPHRAKPEVLHRISRFLKERGGEAGKVDVYDQFDSDRKTLRRTLLYGVELDFLDQEGDIFQLEGYGWSLSAPPNYEDDATIEAFQEAIERFSPYRETLQLASERDVVETVLDDEVLSQSALKEIASELVDGGVKNREINVLIKTADAAGLGEYRAGKKGYETRLILNESFEPFIQELNDKHPVSSEYQSKMPADEDDQTIKTEKETVEADSTQEKGQLKLTVEFNVDNKTEDEVATIIRKVRDVV